MPEISLDHTKLLACSPSSKFHEAALSSCLLALAAGGVDAKKAYHDYCRGLWELSWPGLEDLNLNPKIAATRENSHLEGLECVWLVA